MDACAPVVPFWPAESPSAMTDAPRNQPNERRASSIFQFILNKRSPMEMRRELVPKALFLKRSPLQEVLYGTV